ncbi:MAG: efflux RND transporter periplasmic adaptor subunit [Acidobacteriota bacterium]
MTHQSHFFRPLTALLSLLAILAAGCGTPEAVSSGTVSSERPVVIRTAVVQRLSVERRVEVVGTLLAQERVTLGSQVSGTVKAVYVDFGSRVRRHQLLVSLDATEYQIAVDRAEAGLEEALARLSLGPDGDEKNLSVEEIPGVVEALSQWNDARAKLASAEQLISTRDIPEQRYLELEKTANQKEAALQQARDRVRVDIAAVKSRRADLSLARKRLHDTQVRAPFDGSVVERLVSPGQYAGQDTPLVTLAQTDPLRLRGRIPESAAAAARLGLSLTFRTDAYPGREFEATLSHISPVLDAASRTLVGEARVPNPEGLLKPGMFARISLVASSDSPALMVPKAALLSFGGLTKLFVVHSGRVEERIVETGIEKGDWIEIVSGSVEPDQKVAIESLERLRPGTRVTAG